MKYAVNHTYFFCYPFQAILMPYLQFCLIVIIEIANMLVILASQTPLSILADFIVLAIVAEFDSMIYTSTGNQYLKKLFYQEIRGKLLIVKHTSSSLCSEDIMTTEKDEKGRFRPMKTTIRSRMGINLCYYIWYKSCRLFYLGVYYYFFPMMII